MRSTLAQEKNAILVFLDCFLAELEYLIKPPENCHHSIMRTWVGEGDLREARVTVQINDGGTFWPVYLDAEDFDREPKELAEEIQISLERAKRRCATKDNVVKPVGVT